MPFALAAGLSGAVDSTGVIVTAGLAIATSSIAMGLGGYMAAKSDTEHYLSEAAEKKRKSREGDIEAAEVAAVFQSYGLTAEESKPDCGRTQKASTSLG